jgi:hypothetical protein
MNAQRLRLAVIRSLGFLNQGQLWGKPLLISINKAAEAGQLALSRQPPIIREAWLVAKLQT